MAKRISLSQYKSKLHQIESKQRQAINKVNQEVRKYNQKVKQSVNKYNQEVRAYNARVRTNRQRLKSEFNKLSQKSTTRYVVYYRSVITLRQTYNSLDQRSETGNIEEKYNHFLDLSERETANSVQVMNSLLDSEDQFAGNNLIETGITDELHKISEDLDDRWQGAVFALNPNNPDAARHFCTSAREIITNILEIKAPDEQVIELLPECDYTDNNKPTRRSKIKYLLQRKDLSDSEFESFVEEDMQNIIELFQIFNVGTHGSAGKFNLNQLSTIKNRVEGSIIFLSQLVS